ncbi:hypothetical protein CCHL11_01201 [Colletotrichum chlorophyti]|uniref:F-box domain-containing protein n=1 Tax=Colletotrichum chlorophyti TaxID=708187 RepID=A0A1Q8S7Y0_9PEZI|nr:hypothetical protein CCHL11_01201 [Colletotrichum chlorophyti]
MNSPALGHLKVSERIICSSDSDRSPFNVALQTTPISPPRPTTQASGRRRLTFLDLPYELRLDVYDLLLLTAEPIIVSEQRTRKRVKIEPPEHQIAYLRAPRPRPRAVNLTHRKPHVEILTACKQINHEATRVLYRKNDFIVGMKLCARDSTRVEPRYLAGFFLWPLRRATLLHIPSVTFRAACFCNQWLTYSPDTGITFTGVEIDRRCPDGRTGGGGSYPRWQDAHPAFVMLSNDLWALENDSCRFKVCAFCSAEFDQHFYV